MIQIDIPGFGGVEIVHAVFDFNGTIACEGKVDKETIQLLLQPLRLKAGLRY